jgi:hypothetical protein
MKRLLFLFAVVALVGCDNVKVPASFEEAGRSANIYPDYQGVTVPVNIAPLHFQLMQEADEVVTRFRAGSEELVLGGVKVCPDADEWQSLTAQVTGRDSISVEVFARQGERWLRYQPFGIYVSPDSIDPWLTYRLISPSYVTYEELTLNQRCLESYEERVIYDNMLCSTEANGQCINCHHSQLGNPRRTLFHARQNMGGTLIQIDGQLHKVNLKTDSTISAGVYPAWHPKENLIAFSTNKTMQSFHTLDIDKIEVLDSQSDLILYDPETNEVSIVENDSTEFETFPCWTPDGRWLYYCSAHFEYRDTTPNSHDAESILRYKDFTYNVYRKSFDAATRTFGAPEMVFDADSLGLSATFPRISPDGRFLLLTVGEWGTFHIWHRDADLWLMELQTDSIRPYAEVNSPSVESYHTWSTNGRWIVFSSRRDDGNFTRPFFAHVDADGRGSKPFELPSDDPNYHRELMKSYNVPEFLLGPVEIDPQTYADALKKDARQAKMATQK